MIISITSRTLILAFFLATFSIGYTYAESRTLFIPIPAAASPTSFAVFDSGDQSEVLTTTDVVLRTVTISAPVDGVVIVNSSLMQQSSVGGGTRCSITTGTSHDSSHLQTAAGSGFLVSQVSGTRGFNILGGQTITYNLICDRNGGIDSFVHNSSLTAIFTPAQT